MVTQSDVEKAFQYSNNSAPGPDGVPYLSWRKADRLAVVIIHNALSQLHSDTFSVEHVPRDFNTSFFMLLT